MQLVRRSASDNAEAVHRAAETTSAAQADIVLDVRHVSVEYASASNAVRAVDDVSFALARGQILGLAGESGSGKTTLANAIARLLRPPARVVQGEVLYSPRPEKAAGAREAAPAPVDVLALTPDELRDFRWRRLSMVFQSAMNSLNPVLDISAQIDDVLQAHAPSMGRKSRQERAVE